MKKTSEVSKNQFTVAQLVLAPKGMGLLKDKGSGMAPSMQLECGFKFSLSPPIGASWDALLILYKMCRFPAWGLEFLVSGHSECNSQMTI